MTSLSDRIARAIQALIAAVTAAFKMLFGGAAGALGAVGATLGALLPRSTPGPGDVADEAVEHDTHAAYRMPAAEQDALTATALAGNAVRFAAVARVRGDNVSGGYDEDLPAHVRVWLDALSPRQLARVAGLTPYDVQAHVEGRNLMDGLPPVPAQPKPTANREQMLTALAEIRKIARAERLEAVARATGGGRPAVLPTLDEDDYVPTQRSGGLRPAFH